MPAATFLLLKFSLAVHALAAIVFRIKGTLAVFKTYLILSTIALASTSLNAAEMAKEGNDAYTTTYVTTSFSTIKMGDRTVTTYETNGVTRNNAGGKMFDNMGTRCLGLKEVVGSDVSNRGSCIDMDVDGDQIFTSYEAKGAKGRHVYTGGTGKYSGMSGSADYTSQSIKSSDGRGMFIVPHKSAWKLP